MRVKTIGLACISGLLVWVAALPSLAETATPETGPKKDSSGAGAWRSIDGPSLFYHTATRLKDGKVLVAGGCERLPPAKGRAGTPACNSFTDRVLVYDPATDNWRPTSKMKDPHAGHTAVLLPDGKVMVAGGCFSPPGRSCTQVEIYDPVARRWTTKQPPEGLGGLGRMKDLSAVLLAGPSAGAGSAACGGNCGRVLVVNAGQIFDPVAGSWKTVPKASGPLGVISGAESSVTGLSSAMVLTHGHTLSSVFDPATERWGNVSGDPINRVYHSATLLDSGEVLVAGGIGPYLGASEGPLSSAELFQPSNPGEKPAGNPATEQLPADVLAALPQTLGAWKPASSMATSRYSHTQARLKDGKVLITGGIRALGKPLATAELYDPQTQSWVPAGSMTRARGGQTIALLGGIGIPGQPYTLAGPASFTLTPLMDGRALVVGGAPHKSAEMFTPMGVEPRAAQASPTSSKFPPATLGLVAVGLVAAIAVVLTVSRSRRKKND